MHKWIFVVNKGNDEWVITQEQCTYNSIILFDNNLKD